MRLILIRHAESHHSRLQQIADVGSCTGLTDAGVQQAQALRRRLAIVGEVPPDARIFTSPVRRARETANIVFADHQPAVRENPLLREIAPGGADGMTWPAYHATYGTFDLISEPDRAFAPGGESWNAFLARVRATLQDMANEPVTSTIVAVTHAGFIVASLLVGFAIPRPGTGARFDPRHTSLTIWRRLQEPGVWSATTTHGISTDPRNNLTDLVFRKTGTTTPRGAPAPPGSCTCTAEAFPAACKPQPECFTPPPAVRAAQAIQHAAASEDMVVSVSKKRSDAPKKG